MSRDGESFYAPKSPDLSSYFSQPATTTAAPPQTQQPPPPSPQHHHQQHQQHQHLPNLSIPLPSPGPASAGGASSYRPPLTSPFTPGQYHPPSISQYQPPTAGTPSRTSFTPLTPGHGHQGQGGYFPPQPSVTAYRPPPTYGQEGYAPPTTPRSSFSHHVQQHQELYPLVPVGVNTNASGQAIYPAPGTGDTSQLGHGQAQQYAPQQQQQQQEQGNNNNNTPQSPPTPGRMPPRKSSQPAPAFVDTSPVRTKFPTARIKRIMQADEEVGKVAQQTPIAVGKALELFMVAMVTKSADVAREKNQKRVTAQMLKQVVETDEQFDFLRDIVSKVEAKEDSNSSNNNNANPRGGGAASAAGVKHEMMKSESEEEVAPEPKKRGRGGRRKKAA